MVNSGLKAVIFVAVLIGFPLSNVLVFMFSQFVPRTSGPPRTQRVRIVVASPHCQTTPAFRKLRRTGQRPTRRLLAAMASPLPAGGRAHRVLGPMPVPRECGGLV
eukprot:scaffold8119_cov444-Prasinococcus_capsulatus_cf.AAC.6